MTNVNPVIISKYTKASQIILQLSCQIAFEIEAEQINLNRSCIRKADSESLRLLFLNNRLHCSNDANRMLETFYGLYYQAVDKYIPKKTIRRSKAPIGCHHTQ